MNKFLITEKSKNAKVGPIMVVTSPRETCPTDCPFNRSNAGGCYAEGGPLAMLWSGLDATEAGESFQNGKGRVEVKGLDALIAAVKKQTGKLWRFNQAGDLPGKGDCIDTSAFLDLVIANSEAKALGFTYTHKPVLETLYCTASAVKGKRVVKRKGSPYAKHNAKLIKDANERGFTVNLSANDLAHADELADLKIGPVVTVLPHDQNENTVTPKGRKVVVCPATQRDNVSCATCGLCARQRDVIVGFPAHGASKRKASNVASKRVD